MAGDGIETVSVSQSVVGLRNVHLTDVINLDMSGDLTLSSMLIGEPTYSTLQDHLSAFGMAGTDRDGERFSDGGDASAVGGANARYIDVIAGIGYIRTTDSHTSALKAFNWSASVGSLWIPDDSVRFVGVKYNSGSPVVELRTVSSWDRHDEFLLGNVVNQGGTLHFLNNSQVAIDGTTHTYERLFECRPFERANRLGGLVVGESAGRYLTLTTGKIYDGFNEFDIDAIDTSDADRFTSYYYDGSAWVSSETEQTWDNTNYNNIASGLAELGAAKFSLHWLYLDIEAGGTLVLVYGQDQYNTRANAEAAAPPSLIPKRLQYQGVLVGRLVFQKSDITADFESAYATQFSPSLAASHHNLADLTGYDDHSQYALLGNARGGQTFVGGIAVWNHAAPEAQPAAPTGTDANKIAEIIAILQGAGLCAT